ncbi:MAG: DUF547 domain-containing protein [Planctomycetes bacterium]|nr:DUF547 domain-containing protein [Planctomycetota bacterium]
MIVLPAIAVAMLAVAAYAQQRRDALKYIFGPPSITLRETYPRRSDGPTFDHSSFDRLLRKHVDKDGWIDYTGLRDNATLLDTYIAALGEAHVAELDRDEKLALLINAYNAFTLRLILDHYPIKSIKDIPSAKRWDAKRWRLGPMTLSLNQIEHEQIRPKFAEPRIHFALVCAAIGCPRLRNEAYQAQRIEEQLEDQTRYVHSHDRWFRYQRGAKQVHLTKLYDWYGSDFRQAAGSVLDFAARYSSALESALGELDETARRLGAVGTIDRAPARPSSTDSDPQGRSISLPGLEQACARAGLSDAFSSKKLATRRAFGVALLALGDADERIVSVDGDVSNSTFANMFAKEHPGRFFEGKIAEQNMISVAVGLAAAGKIPFVSTFAKFLARGADQIDMAAISRANIKIVGSHAGVSLGADGPSQMSVSDIPYFRSLTRVDNGSGEPACYVFNPSDAVWAYRCVELMANLSTMCFMRTHRPDAPFLYKTDETFAVRGCKQLRQGDKLTLVGSGYILHIVLDAATRLAESGIECNVFDAYTFPLDATPILDAAARAGGAVVTVEDNYVGGLQSELAEAAAERGDVRVIGLTANRIPKSAKTAAEVFHYVGVGVEDIVRRATEAL